MPVSSLKNILESVRLFIFNYQYANTIDEVVEKTSAVREWTDLKTFKKECLKAENDICIFALVDGRKNTQEAIQKFNENINIYKHLNSHGSFSKSKEYKINWVNATCHVIK